MDNSDQVIDEESQASDKYHCTSATADTKKWLYDAKLQFQILSILLWWKDWSMVDIVIMFMGSSACTYSIEFYI
jgi:hypothetical protein